jgi:hypothetical protein
MKGFVAFCLILVLCQPTAAVEDGQVMYAGGTVPTLKQGAEGHLDTTSQTSLTFESPGGKLVVLYARIDSYEFSE